MAGDKARVGERFGNFEIVAFLGEGGMGCVYAARQLAFRSRIAALKVLLREFSQDPARRQRFENESDILASCEHPNIITVYDRGEKDGEYYFAMEFVDGSSLDRIARAARPSVAESVAIVREVAAALARAHAAGIIHRDIKPANILISRHGDVKVSDFGIAKYGVSSTATLPGSVLGTLAYISPEQLADSAEVDGRTDIYSLGLVLHELLTGKLPRPGAEAGSPRDQNAEVTPKLDAVVRRMAAVDRDERYADVNALLTDLKALGAPDAVLGHLCDDVLPTFTLGPPTPPVTKRSPTQSPAVPTTDEPVIGPTVRIERSSPAPKRKRRRLAPLLAAAAVILVGGGAAALFWPRTPPQPSPRPTPPPVVDTEPVVAVPAKPVDTDAVAKPPVTPPKPPPQPPVVAADPAAKAFQTAQVRAAAGEYARAIAGYEETLRLAPEGEYAARASAGIKTMRTQMSAAGGAARKALRAFLGAPTDARTRWTAPNITAAAIREMSRVADAGGAIVDLETSAPSARQATLLCVRRQPGEGGASVYRADRFVLVGADDGWRIAASETADEGDRLTALMARAEAAAAGGDDKVALAACEDALKLCPAFVPAHDIRIDIMSPRGDAVRATLADEYARHAQQDPDSAIWAYLRGRTASEPTQARPLYEHGMAVEPDCFWPYWGMGKALLNAKEWGAAAATLREARKRNPSHAPTLEALGEALEQLHQPDGAIEAYRAAEAAAPQRPLPHQRLAVLYQQRAEWKDAVAEWEALLRINPKLAPAHFLLGQIYDERFRDAKRAMEHYEAFIKLQPDSGEARLLQKRIEQLRGGK